MEYRTAATSIRVSSCPVYCRRNRQSTWGARAESAGGSQGSIWRAVSSSITPGLGLDATAVGISPAANLLPHRSPTAPLCKFGSSLSAGVDGSADEALELSSHSRLSDDHKQLPLERAVPQIIASPRLADLTWGSGAQATGAKRISLFHQAFADRAGVIDHAKLSKTPAIVGAAAAALRGLSSPYGTGDSRWVRGESSIAALSSLAENRPCPACDELLGADVMTLSCFDECRSGRSPH